MLWKWATPNHSCFKMAVLVLNSEIQVSFFRNLPLQKLVFLKFYSLNEEAVRSKIHFIFFIFIYFHSINKSLRTIKPTENLTSRCFNS